MKISWRLSLWYFIATLIILLLFSFGIYFFMQHLLYRAVDQELMIVVDSIQKSYNVQTKKYDIVQSDSEKVNPFFEYYLIIYDKDKNPVYRSPLAGLISLGIPLSPDKNQLEGIVEKKVARYNRWLHPDKEGEVFFRAINKKIIYRNRNIGWITIALSIEKIRQSLDNLVIVIGVSILCAVSLIGVSGFQLTKKALSPVDRITKKANHISHTNLNERIDGVQSKDELGRLTDTLNNLLERLQTAFESQRQFLENAAHELKTPLSVLRAHWEGELNNVNLSLEMKEKFVHDVETISRLTHLINNLLLLSKTENIQDNFELEKIELDTLLKDVVADATIIADLKEQKISIDQLPSVEICGDRGRLYQLFFNLFDNAVKYTPESGRITLSVLKKQKNVIVEIRDTGFGIPAEDLPHIFERFYRVQKDRSRKTGGSGLGLTICKLIAGAHHGTIEAESKIGHGSIFRVYLPFV